MVKYTESMGWPCRLSLRPLGWWNREFESLWGHGRSSFVLVAASGTTGWSLVQRSPTGFVFLKVCGIVTSTVRRCKTDIGCCDKEKIRSSDLQFSQRWVLYFDAELSRTSLPPAKNRLRFLKTFSTVRAQREVVCSWQKEKHWVKEICFWTF